MKAFNAKLLKVAAAIVIGFAQPPVHAGAMAGGASEVTQILNNIQLLMQSITQYSEYATQLDQYMTQMDTLAIQQLQNAAGLDQSLSQDISKFGTLIGSAKGAVNSMKNLQQSVGDLQTMTLQRQNDFASSGLTWQGYVNRAKQMASNDRQRASVLSAAEESAVTRVIEGMDSVRRYASEISTTAGEHQALRVMNGQMNALTGTLTSLLQVTTARSQDQTERQFVESLKDTEKASKYEISVQKHKDNNTYGTQQLQRLGTIKQ